MDCVCWSASKGIAGLLVGMWLGLQGLVPPTYPAEFSSAAGDVTCLIWAIHTANGNGETNTLTLAAGLYSLTTVENDTDGPTGLPSITSALMLRGQGAQSTVLERAAGGPRFRLLHVAATGTLTLEGLTLRGGDLPAVTNSEGNQDGGGGLRNRGAITIAYSMLSANVASQGGGFYNSGSLTLIQSILNANAATGESAPVSEGGGILNRGTLAIIQSPLRGNPASGSGGGIYHGFRALTITQSTLSGNAATSGGGVFGSAFAPLTINNSTVSGDTASGSGGGIAQAVQSFLTLTNSTVGGNIASQGGGIHGGFSIFHVSIVRLLNTVVAANWVPPTGSGPDCASPGFSYGHNLIGDPTGCPITLEASDLTGDSGFGAYTDTGAPGQGYIPLRPTSPAIDAGGQAACPATDQLSQPRVGPCDIGAIEFQPETVMIRPAVFADQLARLFVSATSSAPPDAALVATVPGCLVNQPMLHLRSRYVLLRNVGACGNLSGQIVTVTSTYGGSASVPLR